MSEKIVVVVPAYNEAGTIARVIGELKIAKKAGIIHDIIVVANGCTDNTVNEVKRTKVNLIEEKVANKGLALFAGMKWAQKHSATTFVMVDADVTKLKLSSLKKLIEPVVRKKTPMSVAHFNFGKSAPNLVPSNKYSGFRAISMRALNPILVSNRVWLRNITTGPYGVETALNAHIFGRKYINDKVSLPKNAVVSETFVLTRPPRSLGTVKNNVSEIASHFDRRAKLAKELREARKKKIVIKKRLK